MNSSCPWPDHRRWRGGRRGRSAAGIHARRQDAIINGLRRAGLKTIGDVASRARHEITARFGAAFTTRLEQALGQGDAPISPRKPLPDYIVEQRFAEPVATEAVMPRPCRGSR